MKDVVRPATFMEAFQYRLVVLRARGRHRFRNTRVMPLGLAATTGIVVALVTVGLHEMVLELHRLVFALPENGYLSSGAAIPRWRLLLFPALIGLVTGVVMLAMTRRWPEEIADPIEANALFGGRMSLGASVRLVVATLLSNASGAAIGMEAAYSQIGAAMYSTLGQFMRLKRGDLRVATAAGAGAAIAAAFNAPLAGAFYGFELVLGNYTLAALGPVALGVLSATLTLRQIEGSPQIFAIGPQAVGIEMWEYLVCAWIGLAGGILGIATMRLVSLIENLVRRLRVPVWGRPAAGGLALGLMAMITSQSLGAGHGAVRENLTFDWTVPALVLLLALKVVAAATSLGTGFRGGLFSTSLLMGGLLGSLIAKLVLITIALPTGHMALFAVVGMGAMGAAIIGAPLTMAMLVLETTGDFQATLAVFTGVIVASLLVRHSFGYSFATWRFHLRGVAIHGAYDVGWLGELTVERLMRRNVVPVSHRMTLTALRAAVPLGSTHQVFVVDDDGCYLGAIDVAAAYDRDLDDAADLIIAEELARGQEWALAKSDTVRAALARFATIEIETVAVVESQTDPHFVGSLSEAHALRRYAEEVERRRSDELGERNLYAGTTGEG